MPIDRAVPSMVRMAASSEPAVMSFIFSLAISSIFFLEICPTFSLPGLCEPDPFFFSVCSPAAFLSRMEAGGVLRMKVKDRSWYTVMITGMIRASFSSAWVAALNCLQNSMMFTPCCPRAGPTGGAGFALPAGICSFTCPVTFFIVLAARLLHLHEVQLHRGGAPEDGDQHLEPALVRVPLHRAVEVGERAVDHPDRVPLLELHLRLRLQRPLGDLGGEPLHLHVRDRRRLLVGRPAHEPGHLGGVLHQVPGAVVHLHLDQDV